MFSNNHLYNRLLVCAVGRSWPTEFYDWIPDLQIREIMQTIASETEEDYQQLIALLNLLGVEVIRPNVKFDLGNIKEKILAGGTVPSPPMFPGDQLLMLDNVLYKSNSIDLDAYHLLFEKISQSNAIVTAPDPSVCAAMSYQFDDRIYYSINENQTHQSVSTTWKSISDKKIIGFHQYGHIDGCFCPVTPGLIISMEDQKRPQLLSLFYKTNFKDWKVIPEEPSFHYNVSFNKWQRVHSGVWWVPGQEKNQKFTEFVDHYFTNWIGNAAETIFEINLIVVDNKTVIVRQTTNERIIKEIEKMGVTVYQTPFRHSAFWDGGLNCVTLPLHRTST